MFGGLISIAVKFAQQAVKALTNKPSSGSGGGGGGGGGGGWGTPAPKPKTPFSVVSPLQRLITRGAQSIVPFRNQAAADQARREQAARAAAAEAARKAAERARIKKMMLDALNVRKTGIGSWLGKGQKEAANKWTNKKTLGHIMLRPDIKMIEPMKPKYYPLQEKMFYYGNDPRNKAIAEENRQIRQQDYDNFNSYLKGVEKYEGLLTQAQTFNSQLAQQKAYRQQMATLKQAEVKDAKAGWATKLKNFFTGGAVQGQRDKVTSEIEKNNKDFSKETETAKNQLEAENKRYMEMLKQKLEKGDMQGFQKTYDEYDNYMRTSLKTFDESVIQHHSKLSASQDWYGQHSRQGLFGEVRDKGTGLLDWTTNVLDIPRRGVNTVRNFVNPDGERSYYDGTRTNERVKSLRQAWNASMNQHVIAPHVKQPFNRDEALKLVEKGTGSIQNMTLRNKYNRATGEEKEKILNEIWEEEQRAKKNLSWVRDLVADPLLFAGAAGKGIKALRGTSAFGKVADVARGSKAFTASRGLLDTTKAGLTGWVKSERAIPKAIRWAGKPVSTADERYFDAVKAGRDKQAAFQSEAFSKIRKLNKGAKIDYKVFDDISRLTNKEAKALQRIVDGKLSAKDRLWFAGKSNAPIRTKLLNISERYKKTTDLMAVGDRMSVKSSRWLGKGRKGQYFADTRWTHQTGRGLDAYNFRKMKKRGGIQSAEDLSRSQVDRLLKSDVENFLPKAKSGQRQKILSDYRGKSAVIDKELAAEYAKTQTGRAKLARFGRKASPMGIWKKSVLKYSPRWHINNLLWNIPASFGASGKGTAKTYGKVIKAMMKERTMTPEILRSLPDNIVKQGMMGKGAASKIESFSRGTSYKTLIDKGVSPAKAEKMVNRWLFDYTTRNWERPLKAVMPFWQWYKGLGKLGMTVPFHSPKAAGVFGSFKREAITKPQQQIPADNIEYKDPDTGEVIKYNNRDRFKGKMKIPFTNKWLNTPFYPLNDAKIGLNPALDFWEQWKSGKNRFGIDTTKQSIAEKISGYFPQADLINKGYKAFDAKKNPEKYTRDWVAESGSTKRGQGTDPSKTNYMPSLDPSVDAKDAAKSFLGVPKTKEFNLEEHKRKMRISSFQKEYFQHDWDKLPWEERDKQQREMAKKHGFTLEEIYKHWARYDTPNTIHDKGLKSEARDISGKFWDQYEKLPKGEKGKSMSQRTPFLLNQIEKWIKDGTFAKNRHLVDTYFRKVIENYPASKAKREATEARVAYAKGRGTSAGNSQKRADYKEAVRTGNWKPYHDKYGIKSEKARFWNKYWAESDPAKRRAMIRANPQYSKKALPTEAEVQEAMFWKKYAAATKPERRELLQKNPQYNRRASWTDEMWDKWKDEQKANNKKNLFSLFGETGYQNFLNANMSKANVSNVRRIRDKKTAVVWK